MCHKHVAASFVVTLSVACVVPGLNAWLGVGAVIVAVGALVSATVATLKVTLLLPSFDAGSWHRTVYVYVPPLTKAANKVE